MSFGVGAVAKELEDLVLAASLVGAVSNWPGIFGQSGSGLDKMLYDGSMCGVCGLSAASGGASYTVDCTLMDVLFYMQGPILPGRGIAL